MKETSKLYSKRLASGHLATYLSGVGIDVGCGDDCLYTPYGSVTPWDKAQGDAQYLESIKDESLDFVYSSHCLEHVRDVTTALKSWVRALKPGGYLYIVVPDYQIYEKCCWPSKFNSDHKHSFSLTLEAAKVNRMNHWHENDLRRLFEALGVKTISMQLEDDNYDYNNGLVDQTLGSAVAQICIIAQKR